MSKLASELMEILEIEPSGDTEKDETEILARVASLVLVEDQHIRDVSLLAQQVKELQTRLGTVTE